MDKLHVQRASPLPYAVHVASNRRMEMSFTLTCACRTYGAPRDELEHLHERQRGLQHTLAAAKDAEAEAAAALRRLEGELDGALAAAAEAAGEVRVARTGGSPEQRRRRKAADAAAARATEAVAEARRGVAEAAGEVAELRAELAAVRRAQGPLRWQGERLAQLQGAMQVGGGGGV